MAVQFGSASQVAPWPPVPAAGGSPPALPPLPQLAATDNYTPLGVGVYGAPGAASVYGPPVPIGQDLARLGADGAVVIGQVGSTLIDGGQQVADAVARNAPAVGQAVWTGAQQAGVGVSKAAPVVSHGVFSGLSWIGHGLGSLLHGFGSLFSFRRRDWQGPVVVVQPDDTLATIAQRTLGDARRWPEIWEWNRDLLSSPYGLQAGMMLRLPPYVDGGPLVEPPNWNQADSPPAPAAKPRPVAAAPPATQPVASPARPAGTHTVKAGESLWAIAEAAYGDGNRWPGIYAANRSKIADPQLIYPGQVLIIPRR